MRSGLRPGRVFLLIVAFGLLYVGARRLHFAAAAQPVAARVVEVYEVAQTDDVGTTYGCRYEFQPPDGTVMRGTTMVPPGTRVGEVIDVRYLPSSPTESSATTVEGLYLWAVAACLGGLGLGWYALRQVRPKHGRSAGDVTSPSASARRG